MSQADKTDDTNIDTDDLITLIRSIKRDTEEIKEANKELRREMKDLRNEWQEKKIQWDSEKAEIEEKINKLVERKDYAKVLEEKLIWLEGKEEMREKRDRRNNIIIKGDEIPQGRTPKDTVEEIIRDKVQAEAVIVDAFWIRKRSGGSLLVGKVQNWEQKREIMLKKRNLKDIKLYIENDLTVKEREVQRDIAEVARAERAEGRKVKIGYRKIKIDNKVFRWDDQKGLVEAKFWSQKNSRNEQE